MSLLFFFIITTLQFITGFGLLSLFRIFLKPGLFLPLVVLTGIAVFSFVPFVLQLFYIPLTAINIFLALVFLSFLLNIKSRPALRQLMTVAKRSRFIIRLHELPSLLIIIFFVFISVWKCYYHPPTPRDLTSGAEVIAEYTVKEKTMINSVFTIDLETTNNPFKPSFITCLQIVYKYAGFPFGQIWLSVVFAGFLVFLFHTLREKLHSLPAGLLIVFFIVIPEMYAYTFMVLFDYSNAVFFFLACYFLFDFFKNSQYNFFLLSAVFMGMAVYIRSETMILSVLFLPLIIINGVKNKAGSIKMVSRCSVFLLPSIVLYLLSVPLYIHSYLPVSYNISEQVNHNLFDLQHLFRRFREMHTQLIFKETVNYYGYFSFIFLAILAADLFSRKKLPEESKNWLYAVVLIYFGLGLSGYLLPLFDIDNSTKRGLFKIFPLMLLCMGNSNLLTGISDKLRHWEKIKKPLDK